MIHKRSLTKLRPWLKQNKQLYIDEYTGFTQKAIKVVPDRYGFCTVSSLADPLMPENFKTPNPIELQPWFTRIPGNITLSEGAQDVYSDLSWYQVDAYWDALNVDWEDSITPEDLE